MCVKAAADNSSVTRSQGEIAMAGNDFLLMDEEDHHSSSCSQASIVDDSSCDGTADSAFCAKVVNVSARSNTIRSVPSKRNQRRKIRLAGSKTRRQLITRHEYHDHVLDPFDNSKVASPPTRGKGIKSSSSPGTNSTTPFPTKLYEMIDEIELQGLSDVVSWQPHGRCFKVHQVSTFKILLQNYFKLSKLASFQRQLNLYGFQRLTVGLDKGSYYHELFLRSRPDLVTRIERVKVKGTGVRAKSNPEDEPNLYSYPAVDARAELVICPRTSSCIKPEPQIQSHQRDNNKLTTAPAKFDIRSILLYRNMGAIGSNNQGCTEDQGGNNDDAKASTVSYDSVTREKPCSIMNGLVRNLSSLNVFPVNGNELPFHSWKNANMQNATFSMPTTNLSQMLPTSNYLRNVSSCILNNNSSFASIFTDDSSAAGPTDDINRVSSNDQPFFVNKIGVNRNATIAVEKLRAANETDDNVSFDKLVDEMFQHDQNIEFPDLIKLATESDLKHAV